MRLPFRWTARAIAGLRTGSLNTAFAFAHQAQFVPALIDEFATASREMPIVFLPAGKALAPVFMMGLRAGENRLVDEAGKISTNYQPAYLRRYPFILGEADGTDPIICIDEHNTILSESEGEPLFDEQGEPAEALNKMMQFTNEYFAAGKRTEAFVALLQDLDLFRPITIEARMGGEGQTIHGLQAIDEAKLYEISDADFLKLRQERLLAPIFAHFFSLSQIERLRAPAA